MQPAVAGAAEILGIDPMYVANEGKFVAFVAPEHAAAALAALRAMPGGELAAEIGEVRTDPPGMVLVETAFGGTARHGPTGRRPAAEDLLMRVHRASQAAMPSVDRRCIVDVATRHAAGRRVVKVEVEGRPSAPGRARLARFGFDLLARGTVLDGAELAIEHVAAAGRCRDCGAQTVLADFPLCCARCASLDVEVLQGEELLVDALELEQEPVIEAESLGYERIGHGSHV